jgi:mycofactocin system glycosyltransferase
VTAPLPDGFRVEIDPDTRRLDGGTLFGGSPARVLRLSEAGLRAWAELEAGPVASKASGVLARRLTDAGIAHPVPPVRSPDVTVVIPVRDRTEMLARVLASLDGAYPVVVVDDGSTDAAVVASVAALHGAKLVRRDNGGPAAARNTGIAHVDTELVAFLDSDCQASADWIDGVAGHFADPLVAAVAPRVLPVADDTTWAGRHALATGGLDLGDRPARVMPGTRVSYLPTAALVVRRAALASLFDTALRYGEDVDLIWRLHESGWRIRYEPSVQVRHHEPDTWQALLTRRFHYGTSAGPLATRHPTSMAPLVLQPWPTLTVAALLARRPLPAALTFAASVVAMLRTVHRADLPATGVTRAMATGVRQTWLGVSRYSTQFAAPLLLAALLRRGKPGRRVAIASLVLGRSLTTWAAHRPDIDPVRFVLGSLADDVAYGAGVWTSCVRARTGAPIRPRVSWRPLRITRS